MPGYIDENELKCVFSSLTDAYSGTQFIAGIYIAKSECETLHTADVAPVIHAHWIKKNGKCFCSNCGESFEVGEEIPFLFWRGCPLCLAKMDEEEKKGENDC